MAKRFRIKQFRTTAFHPQSNGSLERSHHLLGEYLKQFVAKNLEWDDWLELAMFSYNTFLYYIILSHILLISILLDRATPKLSIETKNRFSIFSALVPFTRGTSDMAISIGECKWSVCCVKKIYELYINLHLKISWYEAKSTNLY